MYSQEEINIALSLYHQCNSVTKTVQKLEYPTKRALYSWIEQEGKQKKQRKELKLINTKDHLIRTKTTRNRCFKIQT